MAITRDWLFERLAAGTDLDPEPDFPRYRLPRERPPTPAAVLLALINRPAGLTVLLTQRTSHLQDHAGQISFPGGRAQETDADRIVTALREAEEETGLQRAAVAPIGVLPEHDVVSGYRVTPVVGWVEPPVSFSPDPFEVAELFEVPLEFFLDPANHQRHSHFAGGVRRHYYAMPYGDRYIWGATAGMLRTFYRILVG